MKPYWPFINILVCVAMLLVFGLAGTASAATASDLALSVDCAGFTSRGGEIAFEDSEVVVVRARDGVGTLLYENRIARPTSSSFAWADGERVAWTTTPEANPIVLSITTEAETVAAQPLLYLVVGRCTDLPSASVLFDIAADLGLLELLASADGSTAPSVPPGGIPPRPTNAPGLAESLSGYAIVNTDNLFKRSGPGVEYTPVAIVDGGTRLIVLGRSDDELRDSSDQLWWYVEAGGLRGWVNNGFVVLRGDLRGVTVVPVQGEIIAPRVYIGFTGSLMRAAAQDGADVVCGVQGDAFYPILSQDTRPANWYYIEATCVDGSTMEGWFAVDQVILVNPGEVVIPLFGQ
ncbi:MAG: SH3 domain-containing protein [Anaerolineae bacterium]|nr:SH3 domain-containing protein [Anaerolineae bacterium]